MQLLTDFEVFIMFHFFFFFCFCALSGVFSALRLPAFAPLPVALPPGVFWLTLPLFFFFSARSFSSSSWFSLSINVISVLHLECIFTFYVCIFICIFQSRYGNVNFDCYGSNEQPIWAKTTKLFKVSPWQRSEARSGVAKLDVFSIQTIFFW